MRDRARGPSRILTVLPVFCALVADLSIVFGSRGRAAAVGPDRPLAGQKRVREAREGREGLIGLRN